MRKLYYFLVPVLCAVVLSAGEIRSFIVLDYAGSKEALLAKKAESQQIIAEIKSQTEKSNAEAQSTAIRKVGKRYILSVGPYERDDTLAWAFLSLLYGKIQGGAAEPDCRDKEVPGVVVCDMCET